MRQNKASLHQADDCHLQPIQRVHFMGHFRINCCAMLIILKAEAKVAN